MDVNDYLDREPVRKTPPRGSTRQRVEQYQDGTVPQRTRRDVMHSNNAVRMAHEEFDEEDYYDDEQPAQSEQKKRRGLFQRSTPQREPVRETPPPKPKRALIQTVGIFAISASVIIVSAWQAWTTTSINTGALSVRWVHVTQALLALQTFILFFVIDLRKQ
jgi:hypothetical protein